MIEGNKSQNRPTMTPGHAPRQIGRGAVDEVVLIGGSTRIPKVNSRRWSIHPPPPFMFVSMSLVIICLYIVHNEQGYQNDSTAVA